MTDTLLEGMEQWRAVRLQVFNWGTFSNIHDIPISERGFLFVGASGSGKSTLLDAMMALLFSNPAYNAAAREGDQRRGDRSMLTYVRGAWSMQTDSDSPGAPRARTQYLRPGATFSAVALTFRHTLGAETTLMLVAAIRKSSNEEGAVNRQFFIIDSAYSFSAEDFTRFARSSFDWKTLKASLPPFSSFTTFSAYSAAFCDRLGIKDPEALRLLAKAQSAKNLGDLNTFLRNFMLEEPETIATAERLTGEFRDLSDAHRAVKEAREQRDILLEVRNEHASLEAGNARLAELEDELGAVPWWRVATETELENAGLPALTRKLESAVRARDIAESESERAQARVDELRLRRSESGGSAMDRLTMNLSNERKALGRIEAHRAAAQKNAAVAGVRLPETSEAWLKLGTKLHAVIDSEGAAREERKRERDVLVGREHETSMKFQEAVKEIQSMRARPSNIPSKSLDLRAELAQELGVAEEDLPFAGELLQVRPEEAPWQGAIERVLHGFALSMLVDDALYADFTELLEEKRLRGRLVYYRIRGVRRDFDGIFRPRSLPSKLEIKDCRWDEWLAAELNARFSYLCADTVEEFRRAEQAVTKAGQVKHSAERHEKDDRTDISDKRRWVTGFSNKEKLAAYEAEAQRLGEEISSIQQSVRKLDEALAASQAKTAAAVQLLAADWADIDEAGCRAQIAALETELAALREKSAELAKIEEMLAEAAKVLSVKREKAMNAGADVKKAESDIAEAHKRLDVLAREAEELESKVRSGLAVRPSLEALKRAEKRATQDGAWDVNLRNVNKRAQDAVSSIMNDIGQVKEAIGRARAAAVGAMQRFLDRWPAAADELAAQIEYVPDYLRKLENIERDGLPRHEARFRELLQTQSLQRFADLNLEIRQARQDILSRMEMVNASLEGAPFSRLADGDTHLRIEVKDLHSQEVADFRAELSSLIDGAMNRALTEEEAERRFAMIESLVARLSPANDKTAVWRRTVLDVRNHVGFTACELNAEGQIIESYLSGAGKSGGQRQKLTTTCLAAALRYKLSSSGDGLPVFAPVILDEAFDKADSEFTDISMNIFRRFGFQMIVATPEKSVVTLEPYIGGACYVVMEDRRRSTGLSVRYDEASGKLDFSDLRAGNAVRREAEAKAENAFAGQTGLGAAQKARRKSEPQSAGKAEKGEERPAEPEMPPEVSLFDFFAAGAEEGKA